MKRIEDFDFVEILPPTGKEFDDDRIGEVTNVDGSYIMVKRIISGVEVEMYPNELRLLEGGEADMAYFRRNLWRGIRTTDENISEDQTSNSWLTDGYLREVDWRAAQADNVDITWNNVRLQTEGEGKITVDDEPDETLTTLINAVAEMINENKGKSGYIVVHPDNLEAFFPEAKKELDYDDAMKVIK